MLPRVLEVEVMDTHEEARDYDAMDHSAVNRVFVADFLAAFSDPAVPILDVGTGTAQIPIELCRQLSAADVVAVDLADNMLRLARENVSKANLEANIRIERSDAKGLPCPAASFAAVISNSIVHHIPEPIHVLREMRRVLRSGGLMFVRDLLRPDDDATVNRLVETYARAANAHQRQMFDDSLRAALTLDEIRDLVTSLDMNPGDVRQTTDRHWTWSARG